MFVIHVDGAVDYICVIDAYGDSDWSYVDYTECLPQYCRKAGNYFTDTGVHLMVFGYIRHEDELVLRVTLHI